MSKKVLIISSSLRHNSNSDAMCDKFAQGATEAGNSVEKVRLVDYVINYCTGCDVCSTYNKPCPQRDDAHSVIEMMVDADVIVMATPLYFYAMSAPLKTLIDRCCGRYTEMNNKEFYFIVSAAETNKKQAARAVENMQGFVYCLDGAIVKGEIYGLGVWHAGEITNNPALNEAYNMGLSIK